MGEEESDVGALDVFLSYAREDIAFVEGLHRRLVEDGRHPWVDWEGIPASAAWMDEVKEAIDTSLAVCFVISSASVASDVCRQEVAHAASAGKRIIPLLLEPVSDELIPAAVAVHHWIDVRTGSDFEAAYRTLLGAIDADPAWVRPHASLLIRAKQWEASGRDRSMLLRGSELSRAESWLGSSSGKEPPPTDLHVSYLLQSRKVAGRRQRAAMITVAALGVVTLLLASIAVVQRDSARRNEAIARQQRGVAEEQARVATSRALAAQALSELDGALDRGLLLSVQAWRTAPTVEARSALLISLQAASGVEGFLHPPSSISTHAENLAWDRAFAISSDGSAAFAADEYLLRWNLDTGLTEGAPNHLAADGQLFAVAIDADGGRVAMSGGDGSIRLLDIRDGSTIDRIEGADLQETQVESLAFSPTGDLLALGGWRFGPGRQEPITGVIDLATDRVDLLETSGNQTSGSLAFSPDGRVLAAGDIGRVTMWDTRTGRTAGPPLIIEGTRPALVSSLAFSGDGRTLAAGSWARVDIVDLEDSTRRVVQQDPGLIEGLDFSPNGRWLAIGGDGSAIVWDTDREALHGEPVSVGNGGPVQVAFAPDGDTVFGWSPGGPAVRWNPESDLPLGVRLPVGSTSALGVSQRDGTIAVADRDGVHIMDPATGNETGPTKRMGDGWVTSISFGDGLVAASTIDGAVLVWDPYTGDEVAALTTDELEVKEPFYDTFVSGLSFGPEDRLLGMAGSGIGASIWDVESSASRLIVRPRFPSMCCENIALSPDGAVLAAADESTYRLFAVEAGDEVGERFRAGPHGVRDLAFTPDGRLLAIAELDRVTFLDPASGEPTGAPLEGADDLGTHVAFSPAGDLLAVGTLADAVRLYDVYTRIPVGGKLNLGKGYLSGLAFTPAGALVASIEGRTGGITFMPTSAPDWVERACTIARRSLTADEWSRFVGPTFPYEPTCAV